LHRRILPGVTARRVIDKQAPFIKTLDAPRRFVQAASTAVERLAVEGVTFGGISALLRA